MVHPSRIFYWNQLPVKPGPVVYWMQRDQRADDNWALLYAQEHALMLRQPLVVIFCLVSDFLEASEKHFRFMLQGLAEVERKLQAVNIPFILVEGKPEDKIPEFLQKIGAGLLVTDFNPLRITMEWRRKVACKISIGFVEADAHNILPCRTISVKQEYNAYTLRKKISRQLNGFLTEIPPLLSMPQINKNIQLSNPSSFVPRPSSNEALRTFISSRLDSYPIRRNDPTLNGQSGLSPYLHFGQLSAQRVALEVQNGDADPVSKQAFLEELIVRRELSDNFCLYNPLYDSFDGFPGWAKTTLNKRRDDPRDHLYSLGQFDRAVTHDALWNAAQAEMINTGKMHGYMRMYWAKKILEWTASPEEALAIAIYLNDKYSFDGRDPNGYSGIAWSIGGVHDRPWTERPVFGMIRYMNEQGCRRKFNVNQYIQLNSYT